MGQPLEARSVVDASAPQDMSVTIYRDPDRDVGDEMNRNWPKGFAMISEVRTVTLPEGESTIRFEGVAEGMVGVSAIVTGLPGGTIEKNRNAELLSPAALVNGALGNRVTITRTNPATGDVQSEQAVVRTRADGGLVLQSSQGFEAVRCAGLPEKLTFDGVSDGLSAKPIFSIDTATPGGGTYEVTLTYLAWGFDWQANYVATMGEKKDGDEFQLSLLSWLTLLNDNDQSFNNAKLQIIAGTLNVDSDYQELSDPPVARPLRLTCYPFGSTAAGSAIPPPPPPPGRSTPKAMMAMADGAIMVTGSRMRREALQEAPVSVSVVTAEEENLGDLKLFRVPDRVDVSAKGLKQVAFINKEEVKARFLYTAGCDPWTWIGELGEPESAEMLLVTKNEEKKGLGIALPQGALNLFEPTSFGTQLAATTELRDYARGQDVELEIGNSAQVFAKCARLGEDDEDRLEGGKWTKMQANLTNANPHPVKMRLELGWSGDWNIRFPRNKVQVKNGYEIVEVTIPANSERKFVWRLRDTERD
ncbi:hypothetical protein [uncultured Erythrobacter sp.]|uniref:DUF4139 domain-containing protein n=1 Tax=uncultured Erythrobacter sp. TaxID=263913 RepID=UPI002611616F|nr:hypothetical protein [uncultured Erythrobacter sp.]